MKTLWVCILVVAVAAAQSFSGETRSVVLVNAPASQARLTGNIVVDLFGDTTAAQGPKIGGPAAPGGEFHEKSPWLAAGLSMVVPGTGEFYAESYWKSAAFFAVEVAAWIFAYTYDKKGDRQTDLFQNYANAHWSVIKYAEWTVANASAINSDVNPGSYNVLITDNSGKVVGVHWDELNRMESALGNWYSHNLPAYGTQQYFELIGKYEQFSEGWDDMPDGLSPYYQTIKDNLSPRFLYYAVERGKANTYYTHASTAVAVAIVNHLLSAIDAAWSAGLYNKRLRADVGLMDVPGNLRTEQVPVLRLTYGF